MTSRSASASASSAPPREHVAPKRVDTFGDLAGDLAGDYGLVPDDWQQLILDDWLAVQADGKWAAMTCGLSVARQNGKNGALEVRELFGMLRGEKFLHTAHQVKTAQKHFRRLKHFFGRKVDDPSARFPELNELVAELRSVNGQEAIILHDTCQICSAIRPKCGCGQHDEWRDGGSVEIVARSQGSGRGFTVDVIVCDEAQDMSDEDLEALLSTSSAAPSGNPQWIFTGTPPGPKAAGEVFTRIRESMLGGGAQAVIGGARSRRYSWIEWAADPDADLDDIAAWRQANPGLTTGRLLIDVVIAEREALSDHGFARERLGMWSTAGVARVIDAETWKLAADAASMPTDRFALAIDVSPDRSVASVAFAGQRPDGTDHVELDEQRAGTSWLVGYVVGRCQRNEIRAVVVDALSPAASLLDDFEKAGIRITVTTAQQFARACGQFYDGATSSPPTFHHTDQPQMNTALAHVGKRTLGDGAWVWNRKTANADITPITAGTLALWGSRAKQVKRPGRGTTHRGRRSSNGRKAVVLT